MWEGLQVILTPTNLLKYMVEGMAVSLAMYLLTGRTRGYQEIMWVGLTAGLTFLVLDALAPSIGAGARQGSGFGLGFKTVGAHFMGGGSEDFDGEFDEAFDEEFDVGGEGSSSETPPVLNLGENPVTHHQLTTAPSHHESEHISETEHPAPNHGYYVVPGSYAHRIVKPGYNEDLMHPANTMNLYHHEEPAPFDASPQVKAT